MDDEKIQKINTAPEFTENTKMHPILITSTNNNENNAIDTQRMFEEIKLNKDIPFSKLYLDSYKESYNKIFKKSIEDEEILESSFLRLTKKIYIPNSFRVPNSLPIKNTFAIVVNISKLRYYVTIFFHTNG